MVDLQQKVYIHLSQLYLGLSLDGSLMSSYHISTEDVRLARNCLFMVEELEQEQKLSPSREVQRLLARSALLFREYKLGIPTGDGYLGECKIAIKLANENKFKEMMDYGENLKKSFEETDRPFHVLQQNSLIKLPLVYSFYKQSRYQRFYL